MADRDRLGPIYRAADLVAADGAPYVLSGEPACILTAFNPWSLALTPAINAARDRCLEAELRARGLAPQRVTAVARDGTWAEAGWCFAHDPDRDLHLIRRYHQAGAFVLKAGARFVLWDDGVVST